MSDKSRGMLDIAAGRPMARGGGVARGVTSDPGYLIAAPDLRPADGELRSVLQNREQDSDPIAVFVAMKDGGGKTAHRPGCNLHVISRSEG